MTGSKVTTILLDGWVLPVGEVASGRVCACFLGSGVQFSAMLHSAVYFSAVLYMSVDSPDMFDITRSVNDIVLKRLF